MQRNLVLAILGVAAVVGCETPPKGIEILVSTVPPGASCLLTRAGQPIATAEPTPAIVIAPIGPAEVAVQCRRPGFEDAAAVVPVRAARSSWGYTASDYRSAVTLVMVSRGAGPPR
jgi:hypothetical protein